jgi:membrane-bound lytic murein transglycosylase A
MPDALTPSAFENLAGWHQSDHVTALQAFQRSATEMLEAGTGFRRTARFGGTRAHWQAACRTALDTTPTVAAARQFFENQFHPFTVADQHNPEGLFTGYYEPLVHGSIEPAEGYPVPVYARPSDLVAFNADNTAAKGMSYGKLGTEATPESYDTRRDIEEGSLKGRAEVLCWLSDWVDAFFMHVQGQGRVSLTDGSLMRLSFAAKNGHPYTGIGRILVEQGEIAPEQISMQALRQWMEDHPAKARGLMWRNDSYIFFQRTQVAEDHLGGIGAAKVNLTPRHSLAVDRANWMFGTPLWIDTALPSGSGQPAQPFRQLMIAQDTGSAIKGIVRGDVFCGWGAGAATIAGHMKSRGSMLALLPLPLAEDVVASQ